MEIKNFVSLQSAVNGKVGRFECEPDTPTTAIKEMLCEFLAYVTNVEVHGRLQQQQKEAELAAQAAGGELPEGDLPKQDHCVNKA